jgi:transketolase
VALAALGADPRVVGLDGDVKNSTFAEYFAGKYPDRYLEARIAEQNMVSVAVGLAAGGRVPFISSFAKFLIRSYDQLEMAAITNANVKLCGSHAGVSLAADGPSQMGLPDLAFVRSFAHTTRVDGAPAIRVFQPCDAVSAFKLTELMANLDGLCYMRTHRPDVEFIYDPAESFTVGGFKHLIDGQDLAIVASGYMIHVARKAIQLLDEQAGLSASLIDAYSLPLQTEEILQVGDDCRGQILVVEDNYTGGFGSELADAAARSDLGVMVHQMFVRSIPKSAKTPEETLKLVNLTAEDIARAGQEIFDRSES